jgi:hypothetical protein
MENVKGPNEDPAKTKDEKWWKGAHPVRKIIREILAIAFWTHAIYILHFINLHNSNISSLPRYLYNFALVLFILYYSFFSKRGWLSVIFDLGYIYFWPFIMMIRLFWVGSRKGYKYFRGQLTIPSVNLLVPPPQIVTQETKPTQEPAKESKSTEQPESMLKRLFRPVAQFIVLWSILIITVNNRFFIIFASVITLIGAARAILKLWNLLAGTSSWIEKLKTNFSAQFAQRISEVQQWDEEGSPEKIIQIANAIKFWEALFGFVDDNRDFLSKCTVVIAALISIPFYCYISFLFSCVYFGISKIEHISWSWPSALSTSLYMPFAFTDLPHSFLIRFIGGIQGIAVSVMGWSIFMRHLNIRFERIATAATELRGPLQDEVLRTKIALLERAFANSNLKANVRQPVIEPGS